MKCSFWFSIWELLGWFFSFLPIPQAYEIQAFIFKPCLGTTIPNSLKTQAERRSTYQSKKRWDSYGIINMGFLLPLCSMGLSNSSLPPIQQSSWKACQYFIFFQLSTFQSDILFQLYFTFIDLYQCWNKTSWQERQCSKSGDVITDYQIKYPRAPRKIEYLPTQKKTRVLSPSPHTNFIN